MGTGAIFSLRRPGEWRGFPGKAADSSSRRACFVVIVIDCRLQPSVFRKFLLVAGWSYYSHHNVDAIICLTILMGGGRGLVFILPEIFLSVTLLHKCT